MKYILLLLPVLISSLSAQTITPLEKSDYKKLTSYSDLFSYVNSATKNSKFISVDTLAKSVEGRIIPFIKISRKGFGKDKSKLKVLFFAQQHGNEHSGKEGTLLLLNDFVNNKLAKYLNNLDIILVPQMNPDGSEKDKRRNGADADLNRNHQELSQPEVIGLHKLFNKYLPEFTLDVHEYYPYGKEWNSYGFRRNADEQLGTVTNPNISEVIKNYEKNNVLPFVKNYIISKGFSFNEYMVGGPPDSDRTRYSTVEVNDGRQSFGILNTLSFILEGKNGVDSIDNIEHRALGQKTTLEGLLQFAYDHSKEIKKMVKDERTKLVNSKEGEKVIIRMEHVSDGKDFPLTMMNIKTNKDTVLFIKNFDSIIESRFEVNKPVGYLMPKSDLNLHGWLEHHNIIYNAAAAIPDTKVISQNVETINTEQLEEMDIFIPVTIEKENKEIDFTRYLFVPVNQLYSNFIVLSLEPASMLGLKQIPDFKYLLEAGKEYPILKVVSSKK